MRTKKCSKCHKELSATLAYFYRKRSAKSGLSSACKICNKLQTKENYIKRKYKITLKNYQKILQQQSGCCAICGSPPKLNKRLDIDHDHKVQKNYGEILIRGLLCNRCNRYIIGMMKDNKQIFKGIINYLTKALEEYKRRFDNDNLGM